MTRSDSQHSNYILFNKVNICVTYFVVFSIAAFNSYQLH
jgi:hypothetical protein